MTVVPRPGELWRWHGSSTVNGKSIPDHNVVLEIKQTDEDPMLEPYRGFRYALLLELESGNVIKSWSIVKSENYGNTSWERIL